MTKLVISILCLLLCSLRFQKAQIIAWNKQSLTTRKTWRGFLSWPLVRLKLPAMINSEHGQDYHASIHIDLELNSF